MDKEYVSRSRLFRETFLPGAYARLRNQAYGRVAGVRNSGSALDGVDKEQLREAVVNFVNDWAAAGGTVDPALATAADKKRLEIQSPSEIFVSPSPTMLICKNCKVLDFYDTRLGEEDVLVKMERRIRQRGNRTYISCKRPGCSGEMIQLPYVAVHRCGYASPIYIHHSARRAQNIGFREAGSFILSSFFDVDSGDKLAGSLQDNCPACKDPFQIEIHKRGTPLTSGESFYAQSMQYIALSEERGKLIARLLACLHEANGAMLGMAKDVAEGVAQALLRQTSGRELEQKLTSLLSNSAGDADSQAKLMEERRKKQESVDKYKGLAESDEFMRSLLDSAEKEIREIDAKLAGSSGGFKAVRELIPDDETLGDLVQHRRALEAAFLEQDVSGITVERAIQQASDLIQKESMIHQWTAVKQRYGIESISHIPDLRVVLATIGFTREKNGPSIPENGAPPVMLNAFVDRVDDSMKGKTPVYAMAAKTEALWIRLDPRKVLRWCVESAGWDDPGNDVLSCRSRSHAHLLRNSRALSMHPGKVHQETMPDPVHASAPFHLLHSISHGLTQTARRHTGYDSKSIQEYLLPMDLSILLYVSSVQNYTAGGMLTLFQHYLQTWFDDASLYTFSCAFDPVCTDSGSSCSGCIQIEIGCETFNQGLSRAYLHGGAINREGTMMVRKGFWDGSR